MNRARPIVLYALTCILIGVTVPSPFLAQPARQPDAVVSLVVEAGFNTLIKENAWIPLRITLVNAGEPLEGEVEVVNTALAFTQRFAQPISLGHNARRQITLLYRRPVTRSKRAWCRPARSSSPPHRPFAS